MTCPWGALAVPHGLPFDLKGLEMKANIRIVKFKTLYPKRGDQFVAVDYVEYCAPGMAQRSTTVATIKELSRVRTDADPDDIAGQLALARWNAIQPAYEAWKAGQAIPETGTPLGAWPGITPDQADIIKHFGLKSVEDVADASASVIGKVQLPGMMEIQEQAKRFLAAKDQSHVADAMAKKDTEIRDLTDQLEELRQIVLAQAKAAPADDLEADGSEKPRRGRPPKPRDVPADEVAA